MGHTWGEASKSFKGPTGIENFRDLRIFSSISPITGELLTTAMQKSTAEGRKLTAAVEEFLGWNLALMSGLLKCGGAFVVEGVPVIILGLTSH